MLAGVNEGVRRRRTDRGCDDRRCLHEVGPRPDDVEDGPLGHIAPVNRLYHSSVSSSA